MIPLVILLIGVLIRLVAIRTMGKCFSLVLVPNEHLVSHGLYKYIRHPSYTGSLLIVLGLSLLHPVLGVVAIAYWFFLSRSVTEEFIMSQNPQYIEYMKNTGRFIPKIRRR